MKWWDALCRLVGLLAEAGSSDLAGGAGALAGLLLIAVLAHAVLVLPAAGGVHRSAGFALRDRSERTGVPRHRDPDASGRTRPRGPTGAAAVA
ncbi:DUF6412 domain-containing protein [Actinoplanes utahensis]|uniref:DUF6412 domain-containing protein n=1 Tax=Actinoplanes utahensis TaxID=1869 RepID=UPI000690BA5D|nr:DUF6412 domain-containing protein [Actinoplanes utahensis]GIF27426.1 hypothetical protein Aut01nite_04120 [Actinoplanes utahensis]